MYLNVTLPELKQEQTHNGQTSTYVSWIEGIGNALIKSVELEIGEYRIDKHFGEWLDIWGELNVTSENQAGYDKMVGNRYTSDDMDPEEAVEAHPLTLQIPLRFWFNNHPGLALPINALQYHQVRLIFEFEDLKNLVRSDIDLGDNPKEKLETRRLCMWVSRKLQKEVMENILDERVFNSLKENAEPSTVALKVGRKNLQNHMAYFNWLLERRTFLAGDFFSVADISLASALSSLDYLSELEWSNYKKAKDWYSVIKSKPWKLIRFFNVRRSEYFRRIKSHQKIFVCFNDKNWMPYHF